MGKKPTNRCFNAPASWRELAKRLIERVRGVDIADGAKPVSLLQAAFEGLDTDDEELHLAYQLSEGLVWGSQYGGKSRFLQRVNSAAWVINNIAAYELGFEDYDIALNILELSNDELPKKQRVDSLEAPDEEGEEEE